MRSVELPDRHLMRDKAAKVLAGKPGVQMKGRWLDLERRLTQLRQIKIYCVIWRRADRGRNAREHRQRRAMNVTGRDQLHAGMALNDCSQFSSIMQVLAIHVPNAGQERRMMQEHERGPAA